MSFFRAAARHVLLAACLFAATASGAWAQVGLSTITGIVTDAQGAAVPGASVTATNTATSVPFTGVTNEAGVYTINGLPIGSYSVKMELQGFKTLTIAVDIAAGQTARVDAKLDVGSLSESVEVTAMTAVLQTENAVVGGKFDREQVEKLPIQGRNISA